MKNDIRNLEYINNKYIKYIKDGLLPDYNPIQTIKTLNAFLHSEGYSETKKAEMRSCINKITEAVNRSKRKSNSIQWEFNVSPYFTDKEINALLEGHKTTSPMRTQVRNTNDSIRNYSDDIRKLEYELKKATDPEEIDRIRYRLIELGWNPEVEYNTENIFKARERIKSQYNKEISESNIEFSDYRTLFEYSWSDEDKNGFGNIDNILEECGIDTTLKIPVIIIMDNNSIYSCKTGILEDNIYLKNADIYISNIYKDIIKENSIDNINTSYSVFGLPQKIIVSRAISEMANIEEQDNSISVYHVYTGEVNNDIIHKCNDFATSAYNTIEKDFYFCCQFKG